MGAKQNFSLKVGLVLDDTLDTPDGVQQYVLAIGQWLVTQGHDVHYLVGHTQRVDIGGVHSLSKNMHVRFNGNRMSIPLPTSRKKLRQFLKDQNFDVLHVQMPYSPFMAHRVIQAANPRTAIVGTFHILPNSRLAAIGTQALGIWTKKSRERFDVCLSVSKAAQVFAEHRFKMKTDVLPNVVDYKRFNTALALSQFSNKKTTILFLGRLVPRKGCMLLLQAVYALSKQSDVPLFRVVICGKGPLLQKLQIYTQEHGLNEIVAFEGFVSEDQKPRFYASADISVFPSNGGESFGIVLLEAMASGKAVVLAGDNPGYRSVMYQRPDLLFDPNNVQSLVELLKKCIEDYEFRKQAADWGEKYTASFDTALVGAQLVRHYREALHKRQVQ